VTKIVIVVLIYHRHKPKDLNYSTVACVFVGEVTFLLKHCWLKWRLKRTETQIYKYEVETGSGTVMHSSIKVYIKIG
jgi:hypothetical protein